MENLELSWQTLADLETRFGESFYLLNIQVFRENYSEFLQAFQEYYPTTQIAYSYKTNYTPLLCKTVNEKGGYAEVVSGMEYELALRVGVSPKKIIFNGPYKTQVDIEKALLAGSIVNLDSSYELATVEAIARKYPYRHLNVGIRCNFEIDNENISRFGFDVNGDVFKRTVEIIQGLPNCLLSGLHCHFSTRTRTPESYVFRTRKMFELIQEFFGQNFTGFIDLGGGFFSKMGIELQKQFSYPIYTYKEYASAIGPLFRNTFQGPSKPLLILEPGTALVANAMYFVCKVIDIKQIASKSFALVSGSIHNIKPNLSEKNLPLKVYSFHNPSLSSQVNSIDIVGYTCLEIDYLHRGYTGQLSIGDYVVFDNIGAYTNVLKPPFINPCPPIVSYDPQLGLFDIAKRRETMADLFATYTF